MNFYAIYLGTCLVGAGSEIQLIWVQINYEHVTCTHLSHALDSDLTAVQIIWNKCDKELLMYCLIV